MIAQSIGATGTYATFAAWYAALPGTLADDYTVTVQAGTYAETLDYNRNSNGHSISFVADIGATPVIDGADTRTYGFYLRGVGGEFNLLGLKFIQCTIAGVRMGYTATADITFCDCLFGALNDGNYEDILAESAPINGNVYIDNCLFEDWDITSVKHGNYSGSSVVTEINGCVFHSTASAPNSGEAINNNSGQATNRYLISGCLFYADDEDVGFSAAIQLFGGVVERCVVLTHRGRAVQYRAAINGEVRDCLLRAHPGSDSVVYTGAGSSTGSILERCTIDGQNSAYGRAVWMETSNAAMHLTMRNNIILNDDYGFRVNAGTIDNSYNLYFGIDQNYGTGAGTWNDPETGILDATDPDFDPDSGYGVTPLAGSPVINAGTTADGLPYTGSAPDIGAVQVMPVALRDL